MIGEEFSETLSKSLQSIGHLYSESKVSYDLTEKPTAPKQFNPLSDVPTTQEEVYAALRYGRDEIVGNSLVGIFDCHIGMGDSLLDAYKKALLAHLGIMGGD